MRAPFRPGIRNGGKRSPTLTAAMCRRCSEAACSEAGSPPADSAMLGSSNQDYPNQVWNPDSRCRGWTLGWGFPDLSSPDSLATPAYWDFRWGLCSGYRGWRSDYLDPSWKVACPARLDWLGAIPARSKVGLSRLAAGRCYPLEVVPCSQLVADQYFRSAAPMGMLAPAWRSHPVRLPQPAHVAPPPRWHRIKAQTTK
jgi:hypothetical protein